MIAPPEIEKLHAEFLRLTSADPRRVRLDYFRVTIWQEFIDRAFTIDDLTIVVRWIKKKTASGNGGGFSQQSLLFSTFFADHLARFEERLSLAESEFKVRPRPAPVPNTVQVTLPNGDTIARLDTTDHALRAPQLIEGYSREQMEQIRKEAFSK